jgi:hypothetical protein
MICNCMIYIYIYSLHIVEHYDIPKHWSRAPSFFFPHKTNIIFAERAFGQRVYTQVTPGVGRWDHVSFQSVLSRAWDFLENVRFPQKKLKGVETPQSKCCKQIEHFWFWNELKHTGNMWEQWIRAVRCEAKQPKNTTRFVNSLSAPASTLARCLEHWNENTTAVLKNADLWSMYIQSKQHIMKPYPNSIKTLATWQPWNQMVLPTLDVANKSTSHWGTAWCSKASDIPTLGVLGPRGWLLRKIRLRIGLADPGSLCTTKRYAWKLSIP